MSAETWVQKLESLFQGLAEFVHRFVRTVWLVLRRPGRAAAALANGSDARYLPPFTFMITAYSALILTIAIARQLNGMDSGPLPQLLGTASEILFRQLAAQDFSPAKMLLLALPVVLILLAAVYACRRIGRAARSPALALIAYSAGYAWVMVAAALLAGTALIHLLLAYPHVGLLEWLGAGVLTAFAVALILPFTSFVVESARGAAEPATPLRLAGRVAVLLGITLLAHAADAALIMQVAASPPKAPLAAYLDVRSLQVGGDSLPGGDPIYNDLRPVERLGNVLHVPRERGRNRPLRAVVAVHNASPAALYLFRDPKGRLDDGFWLFLARASIPHPSLDDTARVHLGVQDSTFMRIQNWAEGAAPMMALRPNDVKWIELEGVTHALRTPWDVTGLVFRMKVRTGDGSVILSPWEWVSPRAQFQ
jgi:hypothetical protein